MTPIAAVIAGVAIWALTINGLVAFIWWATGRRGQGDQDAADHYGTATGRCACGNTGWVTTITPGDGIIERPCRDCLSPRAAELP